MIRTLKPPTGTARHSSYSVQSATVSRPHCRVRFERCPNSRTKEQHYLFRSSEPDTYGYSRFVTVICAILVISLSRSNHHFRIWQMDHTLLIHNEYHWMPRRATFLQPIQVSNINDDIYHDFQSPTVGLSFLYQTSISSLTFT